MMRSGSPYCRRCSWHKKLPADLGRGEWCCHPWNPKGKLWSGKEPCPMNEGLKAPVRTD